MSLVPKALSTSHNLKDFINGFNFSNKEIQELQETLGTIFSNSDNDQSLQNIELMSKLNMLSDECDLKIYAHKCYEFCNSTSDLLILKKCNDDRIEMLEMELKALKERDEVVNFYISYNCADKTICAYLQKALYEEQGRRLDATHTVAVVFSSNSSSFC
jgi:hypothetical protein